MANIAVITGASSGVGRATAISLATAGWQVICLARRDDALRKTVELASPDARERMSPRPCDIKSKPAVDTLAADVLARFGRVDALVNAAGTNIPDRALAVMTEERYRDVFDTNLRGWCRRRRG